ncbi:unnamed protein product [Auanema sp. JU1783]|nr:unnamed protein product [Auanema sp. JU1783]
MIDYCSTNRIFTLVLALFGFSIIVFFIEEYAEENSNDMKMKIARIEDAIHRKHSSSHCWLEEPYELIQSCLQCSEFEINALKTKYCLTTGYYDRLNCTKSGILAHRPCSKIAEGNQRSFYWFCLVNSVLLLISYSISVKRKEVLDNHSYMRLQQQLD